VPVAVLVDANVWLSAFIFWLMESGMICRASDAVFARGVAGFKEAMKCLEC